MNKKNSKRSAGGNKNDSSKGNGRKGANGNGKKVTIIAGAVIGAALGVAAGLLMPKNAGKKVQQEFKARSGEFYKFLAPRLKRLKHVGEREYKALVDQAAKSYAELKDISAKEMTDLAKSAKDSWGEMRKEL